MKSVAPDKGFMSRIATAELIGVNRSTLSVWTKAGKIKAILKTNPTRYLYKITDIEALIKTLSFEEYPKIKRYNMEKRRCLNFLEEQPSEVKSLPRLLVPKKRKYLKR